MTVFKALSGATLTLSAILTLPAPAAAQNTLSPDAQAQYWLGQGLSCGRIRKDESKTPAEQAAYCETTLAAMETRHADPAHTPQDSYVENRYRLSVVIALSTLSVLYRQMDQHLSRRSCKAVFHQAEQYEAMAPDAWSDKERSHVGKLAGDTQKSLETCRKGYPDL